MLPDFGLLITNGRCVRKTNSDRVNGSLPLMSYLEVQDCGRSLHRAIIIRRGGALVLEWLHHEMPKRTLCLRYKYLPIFL